MLLGSVNIMFFPDNINKYQLYFLTTYFEFGLHTEQLSLIHSDFIHFRSAIYPSLCDGLELVVSADYGPWLTLFHWSPWRWMSYYVKAGDSYLLCGNFVCSVFVSQIRKEKTKSYVMVSVMCNTRLQHKSSFTFP